MNISDNWCLRGSEELGEYFEEIGVSKRSKVFNPNLLSNSVVSMSGKSKNNFYFLINDKWTFNINKPENKIEITFEQFKEFILNKTELIKEDYQYLIKFLNNL